ncbi:MAG: hypothetical protein NW201_13620 [Gemmatimonadales bacterium]|nr:hypothetical protein [Gemmatimonadales bacterium]
MTDFRPPAPGPRGDRRTTDAALAAQLRAAGIVEEGGALRLPGDGPVSGVRVQDGTVLVRRPSGWELAEPELVLGWFEADSPIATWVRRQRIDLAALVLVRMGLQA